MSETTPIFLFMVPNVKVTGDLRQERAERVDAARRPGRPTEDQIPPRDEAIRSLELGFQACERLGPGKERYCSTFRLGVTPLDFDCPSRLHVGINI